MPRFEGYRTSLLILAYVLGGCTSVERADSVAVEVGKLEDALREKETSLVAAHETVETLLDRTEKLECRTEELAKEKRSFELVARGLRDRIRLLEAESRKLLTALDESEKHYSRLRLSYDTLRKLNDAYSDELDALHADYVAMERAYEKALKDGHVGDSPKIQKVARREDELVPLQLTPRQAARLERLEYLRERLIAEASGEGAVHRFSLDQRAADNDLLYQNDPEGLWKELTGFLGDRFGSLFHGGARWDTLDSMLFTSAIAVLVALVWLIGTPVRWLLRKRADRELRVLRRRVRELETLRDAERSRGKAGLRLPRRHPGFFDEPHPPAAGIVLGESPSHLDAVPAPTSAPEPVILDGGIWNPATSFAGAAAPAAEEKPPETAKVVSPEAKGGSPTGTDGASDDIGEAASSGWTIVPDIGPAERRSLTEGIRSTQIIPGNVQDIDGKEGEPEHGEPPAEKAQEAAASELLDAELVDTESSPNERSSRVSSHDLSITEKIPDFSESGKSPPFEDSEDAGPGEERDDAVPTGHELSGTQGAGENETERERERVTTLEGAAGDSKARSPSSRKRSRRSAGNTEVLSELADLIGKQFEPQGK